MRKKSKILLSRILNFLNPFSRLGDHKYSATFPIIITLSAAVLTEVYSKFILEDPTNIGLLAIFLFIALIVYFSFRDGIVGGFATSSITILYYFYIIFTQQENQVEGFQAAIMFGIVYYAIAAVIGWLRQSIDILIERETDNRRRLNAVVQQLPVGVLITDAKGVVELVNKQAEEILGEKIPVGYSFHQEHPLEKTHKHKLLSTSKKMLSELLKNDKPVQGKEYEIKHHDGKTIYTLASTNLIHNKYNEVMAIATIFSDITDKKDMELRKDDFINMASHELKTPLTSLKLYINSLESSLKKQKLGNLQKIIDGINRQTDRLQILATELLDISRLQSGKLSYQKENFELEKLIRETIEATEATNKIKRIDFRSDTSSIVNADRFRISQVLDNLITNALKYSAKNSKVVVKTTRKNNEVIVDVKDKGIGIDKKQFNKIFGRFYQVSDKYEKTFPGLGMGLYITKQIVDNHGGKIWLSSKKGVGSTFSFSLPLSNSKKN